ncbi:hypothetical protein ACFOVU_20555 [Nocardiopsis sediminis]|uniref:Uncharacterized protein n=1 Tax=Nocardiopsis sediminis TaxID=1778267 RepID=A0ABV8FSG0_9ACTN
MTSSSDQSETATHDLWQQTAQQFAEAHMAAGLLMRVSITKAIKQEDLLLFLKARGVQVPLEAKDRIYDCDKLGQLNSWMRKAATVQSADELFV